MTGIPRSGREVVELYTYEVWNRRRFDLAEELVADEMTRHEVGSVRTMTRREARQRIEDLWSTARDFEIQVLQVVDGGELVCVVYEAAYELLDGTKGGFGSIEVFRVIAGRITEVWNTPYQPGRWDVPDGTSSP